MSPSITKKKQSNFPGTRGNEKSWYPSVRVCVVLCGSPIVSRSCESSGSSCWPLHQRWQGVTPTRRADVQPARALGDVRLFVQDAASVRVCVSFAVLSSHVHVILPLWPPATLSISLWLLQLVRPPAATEAGLVILHGMCIREGAHRGCVSISAAVKVSLAIFGESALIHQIYCLGVTISTGSLLYE